MNIKTVMATGTFDLIHPGHIYYLEQSKKLLGDNSKLVVVIARDSTVRAKKRVPIIPENQRLSVVQMLKPVDKAVLGSETDMFSSVKKINPDVITIGPDQKFDLDWLKEELKIRKIKADVIRVEGYFNAPLDSTCKIIKKIKETDFPENSFNKC